MGQMQDKIVAGLRQIAVDAGLDFADQAQYANTGTVYIMRGLDTLAEMQYGFFATYCSITLLGPAVTAAGLPGNPPQWLASQDGISWHHLMYSEGARLRSLLDVFRAVLATTADEPAATPAPESLYKTTIVIWSRHPGDGTELSDRAREAESGDAYCSVYRSSLVTQPEADPDWDGTDFFRPTQDQPIVLLCDGCYAAVAGALAGCEDGCPRELDHTGLCLLDSPGECQWCGTGDRLHQARIDEVGALLPTAGEEDEGQWFLHWPHDRKGPYPSRQAAWDDWHASTPPPARSLLSEGA